jgi:hypothetical protein
VRDLLRRRQPSVRSFGQHKLALGMVMAGLMAVTPTRSAIPVAGSTVRVSVDTMGDDPDEFSNFVDITPDGSKVAFHSHATDLVPDDTNDLEDVFVYDVRTQTTTRVSVDAQGDDADQDSSAPSIDGSGQFVAFHSWPPISSPATTTLARDVFVRDLLAGTTALASAAVDGGSADGGHSVDASLSDDGRFVAFQSGAFNLVEDDNNPWYDIFVRDLVSGTTVRASVDTGGFDSNGDSFNASISTDGRYVAFESKASDLVTGDTNGDWDVFVRALLLGRPLGSVSIWTAWMLTRAASFRPSAPRDGTWRLNRWPPIWCSAMETASPTSSCATPSWGSPPG